MNYYNFHIGDFVSHTRHLSLLEDLAYRRLLDLYYLHERPLNECSTTVARLINMRDNAAEIEVILAEFFDLVPGVGYVNRRADAEISKFHGKIDAASRAGKASAERRSNRRSTTVQQTFNDRSTDVQLTNNQEPITNNQEPVENPPSSSLRSEDPPPSPEISAPPGFRKFWATWPTSQRKQAKRKCLDRWKRMKLEAIADAVVADVERQKMSASWLGGFDPAPLRYLSERRWEDGSATIAAYSDEEKSVIDAYNATLAAAGWPEALETPFSAERAGNIRQFLTFSARENWMDSYFSWMREGLKPKSGYGFDWVIKKNTFLRAREGNFAALEEAA